MILLDRFVNTYKRLHNEHNIPPAILSLIRYIVRNSANFVIPIWLRKSTHQIRDRQESDIIVSLTSFPARIDNVWQVIECMLRQSLKPKKILLWLSKEQFPTEESVPLSLRERANDVFEIRMVDGDIKSHKKYQYVCREYPGNPVVLVDDDIYYHTNFLNELYSEYIKKGDVASYYCFTIAYDSEGRVLPYNTWKDIEYKRSESDNLFFGSGGGVIFKPSDLYSDITNIELAMRLTPKADDVWLNAMVRLGGKKIIKIKSGLHLPIIQNSNNITLFSSNVSEGGNDIQIRDVNDYYRSKLNRTVF